LIKKKKKNFFGHMSEQLKSKEGLAFKANSDRLVLKTCSDHELGEDAANMLKDKEMKSKQQAIIQIEENWSKSQKILLSINCLNSNLALCSMKIGISTGTTHHSCLKLKLRNDMIGSRNKINFLSFAG